MLHMEQEASQGAFTEPPLEEVPSRVEVMFCFFQQVQFSDRCLRDLLVRGKVLAVVATRIVGTTSGTTNN